VGDNEDCRPRLEEPPKEHERVRALHGVF
jgi:hypothetical protein